MITHLRHTIDPLSPSAGAGPRLILAALALAVLWLAVAWAMAE